MSEPDTTLVRRHRDGAVAVLSLHAPTRRNALSLAMRAELHRELAAALADPDCRVVVLTGEGGHFCAGGDIVGMEGLDAISSRGRLASAHAIVRMLVEGDKPVVAAVEGFAVGAGLSLAAACDIVVASREARFACSFNRLGLVPDLGLAWTLPLRVGMGRARRIMLSGDTFDAAAAERWGLVDELAEPGQALAAALALAGRIAAETAPLSNACAKRLLASMPGSLDDVLRAEADSQSILYASRDFAEGRAAFLAKRKPVFTGT
ncbi:enoyl-CoA hydratase/isomerase family protein [Enterovirga sp.]|jgi:2-(1,2-epoxy-1,2-dihydrophenyl)acetyl-CoA isomerase|uniref:enoyl-CoA hydratase/isomerase family protein n=1 Tax=Enterovirga sp. TaxID=2026350 RepID=UPI0026049A5D|nr:enoyl-CoA hydratase/isomerase family protein [Enterovirga sp.]MDB5590986.1 enoyl-CoA hydratase [Enterovirga sp.]